MSDQCVFEETQALSAFGKFNREAIEHHQNLAA